MGSDEDQRVAAIMAALLAEARRLTKASPRARLAAIGFDAAERAHLARVLDACDGNKSEAARILQIDRRSLQRKLARRKRR